MSEPEHQEEEELEVIVEVFEEIDFVSEVRTDVRANRLAHRVSEYVREKYGNGHYHVEFEIEVEEPDLAEISVSQRFVPDEVEDESEVFFRSIRGEDVGEVVAGEDGAEDA